MGGTPIPREVNINSLKIISTILNEANIPFSIAFGTLLGFVRENNIIEYDDDIDLWIDIKYLTQLWNLLREKGFLRNNGRGDPFIQIYVKHIGYTGVIDLYLYRETDKFLVDCWNFSGHFKNVSNHLHIPKEYFFPVKKVNFCNSEIYVPAQAEELVKWLYGPRWYEPLKKYKKEYTVAIIKNEPVFTYNVPENVWNSIYEKMDLPKEPSSFSKFIMSYLEGKKTILDVACGNGRDSIFFSSNGFDVTAVDLSSYIIMKNKLANSTINYINGTYDCVKGKVFDSIYTRFFLHTISEEEETKFINFCKESINKNGLLLIEARSVKDKMFGIGTPGENKNEYINGHYRRFIDINELKLKLSKEFTIVYEIEEDNLSICENDNPVLIRIIAKKE